MRGDARIAKAMNRAAINTAAPTMPIDSACIVVAWLP
jgi:hypothetical protein